MEIQNIIFDTSGVINFNKREYQSQATQAAPKPEPKDCDHPRYGSHISISKRPKDL